MNWERFPINPYNIPPLSHMYHGRHESINPTDWKRFHINLYNTPLFRT